MKLIVLRQDAIDKIQRAMQLIKVGGSFIRHMTLEEILGQTLNHASNAQLERLVDEFGGIQSIFGVTGNVTLVIK